MTVAETERAAIIVMLRAKSASAGAHHREVCMHEDEDVLSTIVTRMETFDFAADAIERGDHLKGTQDGQ